MSFELTHKLMLSICARNFFPIPEDRMVFFGLRGCLPVDPEDHSFLASRTLKLAEVNYQNPRCTLGQWIPANKVLAVYPGSTCPNEALVASAKSRGGQGANQLLTGYYAFVKGMHRADSGSGHQAFRQEETRVVLRNADDMDFDFQDTADPGMQADNLHCGFSSGVNSGYSSAGCQVVVGFPNRNDGRSTESGPWAFFRQMAYNLDQASFRYVLLNGSEVETMAADPDLVRSALVRFGSQGEVVRSLQKRLRDLGLISFVPDAACGPNTQLAIIRFQVERMGAENADGIVGPNTATQLGITDWPTVGKNQPAGPDGTPVILDTQAGTGAKPKGASEFRFVGDYKLPKAATAEFSAEAGVPWDGAEPVPDWNEYSGCVANSGYAFPDASVPALFYEAKFAIDADGTAPGAAQDKTGLFDTTLHDSNDDPLNSDKYPFIVLPLNEQRDKNGVVHKISGRTINQMGAQLGDLGVVLFKNGVVVPVIYGDRGPALKLGEGAMVVARALKIDDDPNRGGIDEGQVPPGIVHLVFPGTTDAHNKVTKRSAQDVATDALALFDKFRGKA